MDHEQHSIRLVAARGEDSERLVGAFEGFDTRLLSRDGIETVEINLDGTGSAVVAVFDRLGVWLAERRFPSCSLEVGGSSFTLLAPRDGDAGDTTQFLLERGLQLQTALDTRLGIEQAKGVLAERLGISPDDAFAILRRAARNNGMKIHLLAADVVSSRETPQQIVDVLEET